MNIAAGMTWCMMLLSIATAGDALCTSSANTTPVITMYSVAAPRSTSVASQFFPFQIA